MPTLKTNELQAIFEAAEVVTVSWQLLRLSKSELLSLIQFGIVEVSGSGFHLDC